MGPISGMVYKLSPTKLRTCVIPVYDVENSYFWWSDFRKLITIRNSFQPYLQTDEWLGRSKFWPLMSHYTHLEKSWRLCRWVRGWSEVGWGWILHMHDDACVHELLRQERERCGREYQVFSWQQDPWHPLCRLHRYHGAPSRWRLGIVPPASEAHIKNDQQLRDFTRTPCILQQTFYLLWKLKHSPLSAAPLGAGCKQGLQPHAAGVFNPTLPACRYWIPRNWSRLGVKTNKVQSFGRFGEFVGHFLEGWKHLALENLRVQAHGGAGASAPDQPRAIWLPSCKAGKIGGWLLDRSWILRLVVTSEVDCWQHPHCSALREDNRMARSSTAAKAPVPTRASPSPLSGVIQSASMTPFINRLYLPRRGSRGDCERGDLGTWVHKCVGGK